MRRQIPRGTDADRSRGKQHGHTWVWRHPTRNERAGCAAKCAAAGWWHPARVNHAVVAVARNVGRTSPTQCVQSRVNSLAYVACGIVESGAHVDVAVIAAGLATPLPGVFITFVARAASGSGLT